MIPNFNDDRLNFVRFIQQNKDIFDELLESGKYNLTSNTIVRNEFNKEYIYEGYHFCRDFSLGDDPDVYSLLHDLDEFNNEDYQTDIKIVINEFDRWLHRDRVKHFFRKKFNEKLQREINTKLDQFEEKTAKRRTVKRTSQIKDELLDIDYVPEDRKSSVKGKTYRRVKDEFNTRNKIGGKKNKTQKYRKTRRSKH